MFWKIWLCGGRDDDNDAWGKNRTCRKPTRPRCFATGGQMGERVTSTAALTTNTSTGVCGDLA